MAKLKGKVYVMGSPGLVEELDNEDIPHIGFGVSMAIIVLCCTVVENTAFIWRSFRSTKQISGILSC